MITWNDSQKITNINTNNSWQPFFKLEFKKDYIKNLENFLEEEIKKYGEIREIYPPRHLVFNAFNFSILLDVTFCRNLIESIPLTINSPI